MKLRKQVLTFGALLPLGGSAFALDTTDAVAAITAAGANGATAGLAVIAAVGSFIAVPVILRMMKKI